MVTIKHKEPEAGDARNEGSVSIEELEANPVDAMKRRMSARESRAGHQAKRAHIGFEVAARRMRPPRKVPRRLEEFLGTEEFARRGWQRLVEVADYVAHVVDGRTSGMLAVEDRETYMRILSLATLLKAAVQWIALDGSRPRFLVEAERYLAEGPQGVRVCAPTAVPEEELPDMVSGPVVARKGGRGTAGRLHVLAELKRDIVDILRPLDQRDLQQHLRVLKGPESKSQSDAWTLRCSLADCILFAVLNGACSDLLREQAFEWPPWDDARLQAIAMIFDALADVSVATEPAATREERLDEIAERVIRAGLAGLGVRAGKDLFRERRNR